MYKDNPHTNILLGPNVSDGNYMILNGKKLYNK